MVVNQVLVDESHLCELGRAVVKRAEMYTGLDFESPDYLNNLIWYAVSFAASDYALGLTSEIRLTVSPDSVLLETSGLSIPVVYHINSRLALIEIFMTTFHSYRDFVYGEELRTFPSWDWFCTINYLSSYVSFSLFSEGLEWNLLSEFGKQSGELKCIGSTDKSGMRILFQPYASRNPLSLMENLEYSSVTRWFENMPAHYIGEVVVPLTLVNGGSLREERIELAISSRCLESRSFLK